MKQMEQLYEDHFQTVYKYLYSLTRNKERSEDLTQETFYEAMKSYKNFRGESKVSTWLCQIAKYLWYQEVKKRGLEDPSSPEVFGEIPAKGPSMEGLLLEKEERQRLYQKIHGLEEKMREVMYLRLSGELSFKEIGDIVGQSENWARVTFYRGKKKIMEGMDNER